MPEKATVFLQKESFRVSQKNTQNFIKLLTCFCVYDILLFVERLNTDTQQRARVVKLADTLDLGSSALGVRVQVPSLALLFQRVW